MKKFKIGQKVMVTKWEGEGTMGLTYAYLMKHGGNKGVISAPFDEGSYGVDFPKNGTWYIDAKTLKARK